MTDAAHKLQHLLPHWVEHNEAHARNYREWARKARDIGLDAVAERLDQAVKAADDLGRALDEARRALETASGKAPAP